MLAVRFIILVIMILLTSFFVASEFAFVKIRRSKLEQLKNDGEKGAELSLHISKHLDAYLSACQLGITITALVIGWLGESTIEVALHPIIKYLPFSAKVSALAIVIFAFVIVTYLHVVIGELVPKSLSISKTERVVLFAAKPLDIFYKLTYPFIVMLNHSANAIGKLFGVQMVAEGEEVHTQEELLLIASDSMESGEINKEELEYVTNIFEFDDQLASAIKVDRTSMEVFDKEMTVRDALQEAIRIGHTRYPVIENSSKDDIIGYITLQILVREAFKDENATIGQFAQELILIFENTPIKNLLNQMKQERKHIAILIDEYGGTSGLVTFEDIIEEIVGEIEDESDKGTYVLKEFANNRYLIDGKMTLDDFEDHFELEKDYFEGATSLTISGYLVENNIETKVGEKIELNGIIYQVTKVTNRHIDYVKVTIK